MTRRQHLPLAAATAALAVICSSAGPAAADDDADVPGQVEFCLSCHTLTTDEPALEAPPLQGVIGRRIASAPEYEYSAALRKLDGNWDRERLDRFLAAPQVYAPGVNMTFSGMRSAADRKVVLDFLESLAAPGDE
jgi:cytochrome c2